MRSISVFAFVLLVLSSPLSAQLGSGQVSSVVPLDGGCVVLNSLPVNSVENWEVQQGKTYSVTLTQVTDCANGGTDPSIQVIVKSSNTGNMCLTASKTATGTYAFAVTLPANACHTYPIVYCTSLCSGSTGLTARRSDAGPKASHLRASTFGAGCSNPTPDSDCTSGCAAWVVDLGGGCGTPAPTLHSTMPVGGYDSLVSLKGAPPGAPLFIAANGTPFPASTVLAGGACVLHIDPATAAVFGPFVTSVIGDFYVPVALPPSVPALMFRIQAAVIVGGGPFPAAQLTNGIEITFGTCAPFCTASAVAFTGAGIGSTVFDDHYQTVFAAGIDVGVFDDSNGGATPNGLRWTGDAAGALALETFLAGAPAPSGPLTSDQINPTGPGSGGSLAIQTAALTLNLGFNAAGVFGGANTNLGDLVYLKMDIADALSGLTLTQIIAVANQALAGNGLPAGYTFDGLAEIIRNINEAFENCTLSSWSSHRLYNPDL